MMRRRATLGDVFRVLVPNMDVLAVFPPGTLLSVDTYVAEQPSSALVTVIAVPDVPRAYNIVVPKGATVNVQEE